MATKKKVRKNRKIKFSEKNYVEKNYMRGKKAVIPVKLDKIDDLYMKHDYTKKIISEEVTDYIETIAYMIPINTNIELEIHCPEIDEQTQEEIKKSIKNNYGMNIDDNEYDISRANKLSAIFAIVGIFLLIVNVLFDKIIKTETVFSNFLSVVWWVAIWDMIELLVIDNSEKKWDRLNNQQLYDCTYSFVFDVDKKGNIIEEKEKINS